MCHCGRWFSRLDNLRQHSSTVHADEDIPADSLAASGARYQRHGGRTERPARPRAQSQSDVQPKMEQTAPPPLGSPILDRPRRRPDPILVPIEPGQDESAFHQYRDHTPPDSPASTVSRYGEIYRPRTAPYPSVSEVSSPVATPTSSRMGSIDATYYNTTYSPRNSMLFENQTSSIAGRRLSMPVPPTPSLLNPHESRPMALPTLSSGYGATTHQTHMRRDSLSSVIFADDRRRTWHNGAPANYLPKDIVTPATQSLARASLNSPVHSPVEARHTRGHQRLPSIHDVLHGMNPAPKDQPRTPYGGDIMERPLTSDLKRPYQDGIPAVPGRRVTGQKRSGHARSVSNIETGKWGSAITPGMAPGHNPFSGPGPWLDHSRRDGARPHTPTLMSLENNRNSGFFGGTLSNIPSPREHRQSFGSSDSSVSEGIATPVAAVIDIPRILGEPGDAVYHSEVGIPVLFAKKVLTWLQSPDKYYVDRSCEMTGIVRTGTGCNDRMTPDQLRAISSPLDALVCAVEAVSRDFPR